MAGSLIPQPVNTVNRQAVAPDVQFRQHAALPGPTGTNDLDANLLTWAAPRPRRRNPPPRPAVTPVGEARRLTRHERAMARSIFGNAVNYDRVKVHNDEYLPLGLQPDDVAMTPNGEMYFNPRHFKEDFALSTFQDSHWFMHEMVHVWQHQLGYPVMLRGAIRIGLSYRYTLAPDKKLGDYNMEAQGNLLSDYWAVKHFARPPSLWETKHIFDLALYETVLSRFIANPADRANLP